MRPILGNIHYAIFWYSKDQVIKTDPVNMIQFMKVAKMFVYSKQSSNFIILLIQASFLLNDG